MTHLRTALVCSVLRACEIKLDQVLSEVECLMADSYIYIDMKVEEELSSRERMALVSSKVYV